MLQTLLLAFLLLCNAQMPIQIPHPTCLPKYIYIIIIRTVDPSPLPTGRLRYSGSLPMKNFLEEAIPLENGRG